MGAVEPFTAGPPLLAGRERRQQVEDGAALLPELDAGLRLAGATGRGCRDNSEDRARSGWKDREPAVGRAAGDRCEVIQGLGAFPVDEVLGSDGGDRVEPMDCAGGGVGVAAAVAAR